MIEAHKRPPPQRDPRVPKTVTPAGAWDCHFHVIGPQRWYPLRPGLPLQYEDCTIDDYWHLQGRLGLSRGLLVQSGMHGYNYQHALNLCLRYPQRLQAVVMLAPDVSDEEIATLSAAGVAGIRFYPKVAPINVNVARRVLEYGWSLHYLLPSDEEAFAWRDQILALPGNFVIEHAGMPDWHKGAKGKRFELTLELLDTGRCWTKLSPLRSREEDLPYSDTIDLNRRLAKLFPSRVLWGSDWPHPSWPAKVPNDAGLLDLLALWAPEESLRKQILVDNPEELFLPRAAKPHT